MAKTDAAGVASADAARADRIRGHIAARIDRLPLTRVPPGPTGSATSERGPGSPCSDRSMFWGRTISAGCYGS
jgi:hypothetical protein